MERKSSHYNKHFWNYNRGRSSRIRAVHSFSSNHGYPSEEVYLGDSWSWSIGLPDGSELLTIPKSDEEEKGVCLMNKGGMLIILLHLIGIGFFLWIALQAWIEMHGVP